MIFILYIFDRAGTCIYYTEWHRPVSTLKDLPDEDRKLMFGLLFSLKQLMNKANPVPEPASQLPQMGPEQGFFRFSTDAYVLHHLETPTGYKFALAADPQAGDLRGPLWTLYADIFTCYALKNPMYVPGSPILNAGFASAVEGFVKGLPGFGQKF